jgi:predicted phage terminase large subunit-like protein
MGSYNFSAQYLQQPVPAGGALVRWEWFELFTERPLFDRDMNHRITMSWDTAIKSTELANYSVGQTWHATPKGYFLVSQVRRKLEYPDLKRLIINEAEDQKARTILIEDKGSGSSLIQDLNRLQWNHWRPAIIPIVPKDDKVMRMSAQTSKLEAGQVFLPSRADWLDDFRSEVCAFPNGSNDDQVDAMSQYLQWEDDRSSRFTRWGTTR